MKKKKYNTVRNPQHESVGAIDFKNECYVEAEDSVQIADSLKKEMTP